VSLGRLLANTLKSSFRCDAESASSNSRIMRTTQEWLSGAGRDFADQLIIIQWSTWEREEWIWNDKYYQIGASGVDHVPPGLEPRYKEFVARVDWTQKTQQAHEEIWQFHLELQAQGIRHIFFNGNNDFSSIKKPYDWGSSYILPYDSDGTYDSVIRSQGIETVMPNSWHFGRDGHSVFHCFILDYIIKNKLV
jgi:hypothetical protein